MNSIAKILNAIQICRNAYVRDIPAPEEQLPETEQEHWAEVIADKEQVAPVVILACSPDQFLMLMVYSIRYHPGERLDPADMPPLIYAVHKYYEDKGELPPGCRNYPLCDIVLFEPSGTFNYKGKIYNFKTRSFYDELTNNSLSDGAEASGIILTDANFISIYKDSGISKVCSAKDFKNIEDYFKSPGNIVKYYSETASTIKSAQICH